MLSCEHLDSGVCCQQRAEVGNKCLDSTGVCSDRAKERERDESLDTSRPYWTGESLRAVKSGPGLAERDAGCPPGLRSLSKHFEEEERLRHNAWFVPTIMVPGAAPMEFEAAVLRLRGCSHGG